MTARRRLVHAPWPAGVAATSAADAFGRRASPAGLLAGQAGQIAAAAQAMAARFRRGGKLMVFGEGAASTDAQHIAVEFIHPVIVGKRALPAISLTCDAATVTGVAAREGLARIFGYQIEQLGDRQDIALGISRANQCPSVLAGLRTARELGLLTVALTGGEADAGAHEEQPDYILKAGSADPLVAKENQVTTYHILWELVHVFLEQPGSPSAPGPLPCRDDVCITCSDTAVAVTVTELLDDGLAVVATDAGPEEVSVALVTANVGDTILVHAGEAIAVIKR